MMLYSVLHMILLIKLCMISHFACLEPCLFRVAAQLLYHKKSFTMVMLHCSIEFVPLGTVEKRSQEFGFAQLVHHAALCHLMPN
jgi:hypothetical protein